HGAMPLSHSLDTIGPLARSAEDCALILAAIAGFDPQDPLSSREPAGNYFLAKRKFRVALSSDWIERHAEPEVAAAVLAAARDLGATLIEVEPPEFDTLSAHCVTVMQAEASAQHARWMRERAGDYSSAVRSRRPRCSRPGTPSSATPAGTPARPPSARYNRPRGGAV